MNLCESHLDEIFDHNKVATSIKKRETEKRRPRDGEVILSFVNLYEFEDVCNGALTQYLALVQLRVLRSLGRTTTGQT